jgi:MFS family permease
MAHTPGQARRAGIAALVGTTLEWYDFLVYGTAAALVLNKLFFPSVSSTAGTLATFATYAVGFLARPLGGMVLGTMGDRLGRKTMLIVTLLMMGTATTPIGLLRRAVPRLGLAGALPARRPRPRHRLRPAPRDP